MTSHFSPLTSHWRQSAASLLALGLFAISLMAHAVQPPPDGGYPGFNTAEGQNALFSLHTGGANTGVGWYALFSVTDGTSNTAVGAGTLVLNTGDSNTATGTGALLLNSTGEANTGTGALVLLNNKTGSENSALGSNALTNNISGSFNTAIGASALESNTDGDANTAVGIGTLFSNHTGGANTAVGANALAENLNDSNTGVGYSALQCDQTGFQNTAIGYEALIFNISGARNTAVGYRAGNGVSTAINVTCIGSEMSGQNVNNTTWIANVYNTAVISGIFQPVVVSDTGQIGVAQSSERFKNDIATMDKASEAILALRPVTFHYKTDTTSTPQFGLIAEEVAKVNSALVLPDKEGKPYSVRYDAVNAMLLNEFLKEYRTVQEQGAMIARQQKQIEELTVSLEKVSAQFETSKAKPRVIANNP